ncbi:MAG: KEOPS complex kinase/ATPase Bud32 [Candidatus Pacearchaeota archaeon]
MSGQKIIQQGAEAKILLDEKDKLIIKDRISKNYRLPELDKKIRVKRTKTEAKLMEKASRIINVPKIKKIEESKIILDYIQGKKLSTWLDKLQKNLANETCKKIGQSIAKLHDNNIIHGDLTTSNIILDKNNQVWFIDFGLGFHSERIEDKAVDLHLIRQALEAKHFLKWKEYWKNIESGYKVSRNYEKTIEQLKKVESRGRYKEKY